MPLSFKTDDINRLALNAEAFPKAFLLACPDAWYRSGEGVFSWSVFRFYRARLLTHTGVFEADKPFLLDLHYLRTLKGEQIVTTSIEEISRLFSISDEQRAGWTQALTEIIPDVCLGDRLLGWFMPGNKVEFFSASHALGLIEDPEFVHFFSAIWLDERTRSPQLRHALLGNAEATPARETNVVAPQEASA